MSSQDLNRPRIFMVLGGTFFAGFLFKNAMDYLDMGRTGFALADLALVAAFAGFAIAFGIIITRAPRA
jgi:hypothetical protein